MARSEAPVKRKRPDTATPIVLRPPRQSSTLLNLAKKKASDVVERRYQTDFPHIQEAFACDTIPHDSPLSSKI